MAGRAARVSTTIPSIRPRCSPSASDASHSKPSPPRTRMLGYDWPRFHAAVNDLPAALLFVTVLFDLGAWVTKRDSLKSAAVWTLWAGVIGGWVAVLAGLQVLSVAGLVAIIWTGVLGSKLMFEHAAGIPNATLQAEIENREAGHHHEAGEAEEQQHAAPADTAKAAAHTHAPGTPPHKH